MAAVDLSAAAFFLHPDEKDKRNKRTKTVMNVNVAIAVGKHSWRNCIAHSGALFLLPG